MHDYHSLATWEHDGVSYSVSVRLENGEPKELIFEGVTAGKVRSTSVTATEATLDELVDAWSPSRRRSVMSFQVRQVLDIASGLHQPGDRTP